MNRSDARDWFIQWPLYCVTETVFVRSLALACIFAPYAVSGCAKPSDVQTRDFVQVSSITFKPDRQTVRLRLKNASEVEDACFAPFSLPQGGKAAGFRVFSPDGAETQIHDQGYPVFNSPDFVLHAGERITFRTSIDENFEASLSEGQCVVLRIIYVRCGDLPHPVGRGLHDGLPIAIARQVRGSWQLVRGALKPGGEECSRFIDVRQRPFTDGDSRTRTTE